MVLRGEPGIGKTAVLGNVSESAAWRGMTTVTIAGLEAEAPLGCAALHRLLQFRRGDDGRARQTGGTGLGLAIVNSVVAAHHGQVSLDTAPATGAPYALCCQRSPPGPRATDGNERDLARADQCAPTLRLKSARPGAADYLASPRNSPTSRANSA